MPLPSWPRPSYSFIIILRPPQSPPSDSELFPKQERFSSTRRRSPLLSPSYFPFSSGLRSFIQILFLPLFDSMASQDQGRPLPKFGEWDVNDPASAEGFTVIFNKARDEKKTGAASGRHSSQRRTDSRRDQHDKEKESSKKRWFCFGP